ncbi:hypothetical protein G6F22_017142 [Rhizopus arrhizus]|nr:hypothetical protein G6F22_017142 [Rhizopus arrhizus]
MTGAGAPAAELACRYLVAEQYGPPIACAGAVTLHMEAHQHAVGIECLAPAGVRHDAMCVHDLQERGNDVLRWVRCVHSAKPLEAWSGSPQPVDAQRDSCRAQCTWRPADAAGSAAEGRR